jgi:hypothetical protein
MDHSVAKRHKIGKPPPEHRCQGTAKQTGAQCGNWKKPGYEVCHIHGGKTPRGVALPQFDHGRFSRSIPARLSQSYEEALTDPKRLELEDELALIVSRNKELLSSLYSGESGELWRRLRTLKRAMDKALRDGNADEQADHFNGMLRLIERGAADVDRWDEFMSNVDQQRRLAESERKRRVEEHQVATTEEILAIMGAVLAIITRHVRDERIRRAIGTDIDGLVGGSGGN